MSGAEVKPALDNAVRAIDTDIKSQNGYGF